MLWKKLPWLCHFLVLLVVLAAIRVVHPVWGQPFWVSFVVWLLPAIVGFVAGWDGGKEAGYAQGMEEGAETF